MNKEKFYITLWAISLLCPLLVLFFMYSGLNLLVVLSSLSYKAFLGILGIIAASQNWGLFKEEAKMQKKALVPFFILAIVILQVVVITVFMVLFSSSGEIATGSGFALVAGFFILFLLGGTYCWEVQFLKLIENKPLRIAFCISTPVLLYTSEVIVLIRIMGL